MSPPRALPRFRLGSYPSNDDHHGSFRTGNIGRTPQFRQNKFLRITAAGAEGAKNDDVCPSGSASLCPQLPSALVSRKGTAGIARRNIKISPNPSPPAPTLPLPVSFSCLSIRCLRLCLVRFECDFLPFYRMRVAANSHGPVDLPLRQVAPHFLRKPGGWSLVSSRMNRGSAPRLFRFGPPRSPTGLDTRVARSTFPSFLEMQFPCLSNLNLSNMPTYKRAQSFVHTARGSPVHPKSWLLGTFPGAGSEKMRRKRGFRAEKNSATLRVGRIAGIVAIKS